MLLSILYLHMIMCVQIVPIEIPIRILQAGVGHFSFLELRSKVGPSTGAGGKYGSWTLVQILSHFCILFYIWYYISFLYFIFHFHFHFVLYFDLQSHYHFHLKFSSVVNIILNFNSTLFSNSLRSRFDIKIWIVR